MINSLELFLRLTVRKSVRFAVLGSVFLASIFVISSQLQAEDKSDANKKKKTYDVGSIVRTGATAEHFSNHMAFDYMQIQPEAKISVKTIGAYNVYKAVIEKTAQLGVVVGKGPTAELEKILHDTKENLIIKKLGTVGMAVVVNKGSPVGDISVDDLIKVYTGQITNWSEIFGLDQPIHVYAPSPSEFAKVFISEELLPDGQLITASAISKPSSQLNSILQEDPNGIGLVSFSGIGPDVKALRVNHVVATTEQIVSKKYPLTSELRVLYLDSANHTTHDFAKFLLTRKLNKKWLDEIKIVGVEEVED